MIFLGELPAYKKIDGHQDCLGKLYPNNTVYTYNETEYNMTVPGTNITVTITPNSTNLTDCIPLEKPQECPEDVWFQILSKENDLGLDYCQSGEY